MFRNSHGGGGGGGGRSEKKIDENMSFYITENVGRSTMP